MFGVQQRTNVETSEFQYMAVMPGLKESEISVRRAGSRVRITVNLEPESDDYISRSGIVIRRPLDMIVDLPENLDYETFEANYEAGVLILSVKANKANEPVEVPVNFK